jgi:hypothetical protein
LFWGMGFQEPQELLQSQENKALEQQKPWGFVQESSIVAGASHGGTKPTGLHLLLPTEQQKPWVLLISGHQFPWFQGEGSRLYSRGESTALSSCVCREA